MRTILAQLKQYKKDSILTPLFTALEVIMEVMLPFITALIIDEGIQEGNMEKGIYLWRNHDCSWLLSA